jgi:predicted Zn-dependent protease
MKNLSKFLLVIFLPLTVFLSSCEENSVSLPDFNLFSPADDAELGAQLNDEISSNPSEYQLLNNTQIQNYLDNMLDDILDSPEIEYRNTFDYTIQVIQKDEINAFAAPGGYIYVYTGLLKFLDYEATLAAIIAHEVAHVERRHATQRMTKQYGYSVLAGVLLGDDPSTLEQIASNLLTGLGLLQNSREDEYEADEYSFNYLQSTKWYPGAGIFFFDKVKSNESSSLFEELLSTHPMPEERIEALEKLIQDANLSSPNENNLFENDYQQFKKLVP